MFILLFQDRRHVFLLHPSALQMRALQTGDGNLLCQPTDSKVNLIQKQPNQCFPKYPGSLCPLLLTEKQLHALFIQTPKKSCKVCLFQIIAASTAKRRVCWTFRVSCTLRATTVCLTSILEKNTIRNIKNNRHP